MYSGLERTVPDVRMLLVVSGTLGNVPWMGSHYTGRKDTEFGQDRQ